MPCVPSRTTPPDGGCRPDPDPGSSLDQFARRLLARSDLFAVFAVVVVVVMMIVPLPTGLISLLVTLNIAGALVIIASTMYVKRALEFAAFPSLLLLTTLFRLAINVSVTRLVLSQGDAGSVIHAFGKFVVGGNVVVGLVVFLILIVIQFVVITNGAGRVAEVAARFTLDAMPGKQMAIDADLNAGLITEEQARERRAEISREADFYGAMDGASKFVKGDADRRRDHRRDQHLRRHRRRRDPAGHAVRARRSRLLAPHDRRRPRRADPGAADLDRGRHHRHAARRRRADLGAEITGQMLGQPIAPTLAGGVIMRDGPRPGPAEDPVLPGRRRPRHHRARRQEAAGDSRGGTETADAAPRRSQAPSSADAAFDALVVDPLELAIGFGLVPMADKARGGGLLARVGVIRRQIASEFGIVIAPVRIFDDVSLESHEYVIKVRGNEAARWRVIAGHRLAMNTGDAMPGLAGIPTIEPAFGLPAVWIEEAAQAEADALGYTVVDAESVMVTHLTETIRANAAELLTREETKRLLDALKERNSAAVEDVVPDKLGLGEVQRVLQQLLREGVSVRDLGSILEAIGDRSATTRDPPRSSRRPARRSPARSPAATSTRSACCRRSRSARRRAGGARVARADLRRRTARDGAGPRRGAARGARPRDREGDDARPPPGDALLEPHPAPRPHARRAGLPAAAGDLLQRGPAGHPGQVVRDGDRMSAQPKVVADERGGDPHVPRRHLEAALGAVRQELGAEAIVCASARGSSAGSAASSASVRRDRGRVPARRAGGEAGRDAGERARRMPTHRRHVVRGPRRGRRRRRPLPEPARRHLGVRLDAGRRIRAPAGAGVADRRARAGRAPRARRGAPAGGDRRAARAGRGSVRAARRTGLPAGDARTADIDHRLPDRAGLDLRLAESIVSDADAQLRAFDPAEPFANQVREVLASRIGPAGSSAAPAAA